MSNAERDTDICRRYAAGESLRDLATRYHISHERIRRILMVRGVRTKRKRMASPRDEFLGVNISKEDKAALQARAEREGISMSQMTSDIIKEKLKQGEV